MGESNNEDQRKICPIMVSIHIKQNLIYAHTHVQVTFSFLNESFSILNALSPLWEVPHHNALVSHFKCCTIHNMWCTGVSKF